MVSPGQQRIWIFAVIFVSTFVACDKKVLKEKLPLFFIQWGGATREPGAVMLLSAHGALDCPGSAAS